MLFKRKLIFLLVFLTILIFASIISDNSRFGNNVLQIDTNKFTKTLLEKKSRLDTILNKLVTDSRSNDLINLFSKTEYTKDIEETGFTLLIYENDSLKFWSDNSIALLDEFYRQKFEKSSIIYLNNSWATPCIKKEEKRTYVGLILIKKQYSYENDLIKNGFQDDFNIGADVTISKTPSSEGIAIVDQNGDFLFSLIPDYSQANSGKTPIIPVILYGLTILTLLFFLYYLVKYLSQKKPSNFWLLFLIIDLFLLRYLMIKYQFPAIFYTLDFFGPQFYATSQWLPSLGDFLINSLFLTFTTAVIYKLFKFSLLSNNLAKLFSVIYLFLIELFYLVIIFTAKTLIYNSSISLDLHNILNTNAYTFVAILILGLLILSFIILSIKIIYNYSSYFKPLVFFAILASSLILFGITIFLSDIKIDIFSISFLIGFLILLSIITQTKGLKSFSSNIFYVAVISIFVTGFIYFHYIEKEKTIRKLLVVNLANERDPIGEIQLEEFESKLKTDKYIYEQLSGPYRNADIILNHLLKYYFHGYWGKYDIEITLCSPKDSIGVEANNRVYNCYQYFSEIDKKDGIRIGNTNFYYLDNNNGRFSYSGKVPYFYPADSSEITLFIRLDSRLISTELGYPELLLENNLKNSNISKYSYAKYIDGMLMAKQGEFSYDLKPGLFSSKDEDFSFYNYNKYSHLVYRAGKDNIIVISSPTINSMNFIIAFSYVLIFFFLLSLCYYIYSHVPFSEIEINFKSKIQISIISIMFLSLIVIGIITIYYNINQFQKNHFKIISEKTQSVLVELEHKFGTYKELTLADRDDLIYWLIKFSNVFYSDINVYDLNGNMLATSRREIFSKGLIDSKINPKAYCELRLKYKSEFIHSEKIGGLTYLSAYVPFNNMDDKQLAYLNLPYFTKQNILTAEISSLIIAFINIYILLFMIAIAISVLISNSITKPLRLIQRRFQNIQLDKINEPIIYNKKDEIGELITEYNRMLKEIAKSAELLGKSERESAWREMAKQIAHEIKNPLTPMKLSIQHLNKAWENKDENYSVLQQKVTTTLIEQIDSLSTIAAEFSNFALMPKAKNEALNLSDKIQNFTNLFKDVPQRVEVNLNDNFNVFVFADKEQLSRVFNNLINNSIQAINDETHGLINIELNTNSDFAIVSIKDNGSGISDELKDKIFEPNFTTKTSGMGLGLAMVKKIIEDTGGRIWFDTEINIGTTFYIELPIYKG